jgi:hypothetical protein
MENQIVNPYARKRKVESSKAPGDLVERSQKGIRDEQKNGQKNLSLSRNAAASKKSKGNQNKTLQMSQPKPAYNLPMSVEYARALIKNKSFHQQSHNQKQRSNKFLALTMLRQASSRTLGILLTH